MWIFLIFVSLVILYFVFQKKDAMHARDKIYWDYKSSVPCEGKIEIEYSDAQGVKTKRRVDINSCIFEKNDSMFTGYCHLRGEVRSFLASRVYSAVDCDTGSVIYNINNYLKEKYTSSPHAKITKVFSENSDQLNILYYLGKLDKQLRTPERDVIYCFIKDMVGDNQITEQHLKGHVDGLMLVSDDDFHKTVERLAKLDKEKIDIVFRAAANLYESKKTHRIEETEAIEFIKKAFNK